MTSQTEQITNGCQSAWAMLCIIQMQQVDSDQPLGLTPCGDRLVVDNVSYLGSCNGSGGIEGEILIHGAKARSAFVNRCHLWRRRDISLQRSRLATLLRSSKSWAIQSADVKGLDVFDHRYLRSWAYIRWERRVRNERGSERTSSMSQTVMNNAANIRWSSSQEDASRRHCEFREMRSK